MREDFVNRVEDEFNECSSSVGIGRVFIELSSLRVEVVVTPQHLFEYISINELELISVLADHSIDTEHEVVLCRSEDNVVQSGRNQIAIGHSQLRRVLRKQAVYLLESMLEF